MESSSQTPSATHPEPFPYHLAMADYLQSHYADLWRGLSSEQWEQEHAGAVLLELNKTSKALTEDSAPELFESLHTAKAALGMEAVTVTLWEVPEREEFPDNAVFWVSDEVHLAVKKSHLQSLTKAERETLLRIELTRWRLWDGWEGRFRIAERLLKLLLNNARQEEAEVRESWKRWNEATDSFAGQTEKESMEKTIGLTKRPLRWEHLDLLEREQVSEQTRRLIRRLLQPTWFQTPATLAHAGFFFPDFTQHEIAAETDDEAASIEISLDDPQLRDYFCYLLLDFASADKDLGEKAFAECLKLARGLACEARFLEIIEKELEWSEEDMKTLAGEPPAENSDIQAE